MKKTLLPLIICALTLVTLTSACTAAFAEGNEDIMNCARTISYTTAAETVEISGGKCNVRMGPGKGYGTYGSVQDGAVLDYAESTRTDYRGVDWYSVYYNGKTGRVSSRYAVLR